MTGDGKPDVLVSNSQSNNVMLLPGVVGDGLFNDQNPRVFPVGNSPGPMYFGNFDGRPGLLTVNSGSNDLTLISDFTVRLPRGPSAQGAWITRWRCFVFRTGNGFDNVIVANNGNGHLALLKGGGGPDPFARPITSSQGAQPPRLSPPPKREKHSSGGRPSSWAALARM